MVGYNVQTAVDATHHLIVAHEVTNIAATARSCREWPARPGPRWARRRSMCWPTAATSRTRRSWPASPGRDPYVPKPLTSGPKSKGRFGKQDFVYVAEDDVYRCPPGRFSPAASPPTRMDQATRLLTKNCPDCPLKGRCTTSKERRIKRWEHEAVIDAMQARLDRTPGP